ncbi:MAG: ATPase, partial [Chloroflexus aggregans]
ILLGLLILLAVASDSVILGWLRRLWAAPVLPMEASNER